MPIVKIKPESMPSKMNHKLTAEFLDCYNYLREPPCDKEMLAEIAGEFGMEPGEAVRKYMSVMSSNRPVSDIRPEDGRFVRMAVRMGYSAYMRREASGWADMCSAVIVELADTCSPVATGVPEGEMYCIFPGSPTPEPVIRL